eukprot:714098_1
MSVCPSPGCLGSLEFVRSSVRICSKCGFRQQVSSVSYGKLDHSSSPPKLPPKPSFGGLRLMSPAKRQPSDIRSPGPKSAPTSSFVTASQILSSPPRQAQTYQQVVVSPSRICISQPSSQRQLCSVSQPCGSSQQTTRASLSNVSPSQSKPQILSHSKTSNSSNSTIIQNLLNSSAHTNLTNTLNQSNTTIRSNTSTVQVSLSQGNKSVSPLLPSLDLRSKANRKNKSKSASYSDFRVRIEIASYVDISVSCVSRRYFDGNIQECRRLFSAVLDKFASEMPNRPDEFGELTWKMRSERYREVLSCLKRLRCSVDEIPKTTVAHFGDLSTFSDDTGRMNRLPEYIRSGLLPFQSDGVRFALRRAGRVLIADEMGTGKTLQALCVAYCYRDEWPLLVVVPASLRSMWAAEIERWFPEILPSHIQLVRSSNQDIDMDKPVTITSYAMLANLSQRFLERSFQVVITDESHQLKSKLQRVKRASRTLAVSNAVHRAKRAILLSGTPCLSAPFNLFEQVDALRQGLLSTSAHVFAKNYCELRTVIQRGKQVYSLSGGSRLVELQLLLKSLVMIRRLKEDVQAELPELRRQVCLLDVSEKNLKSNGIFTDAVEIPLTERNNSMTREQRLGIAKVDEIKSFLTYILEGLESDAKLIVFGHHKLVISALVRYFDDQRITTELITGSNDETERTRSVARFQSDSAGVRVILVSITAGNVGLDLSRASHVVFAELPQTAADLRQAESRAHRRHQRNCVNSYFLIARGTFEEQHWQQLDTQLTNTSTLLDGHRRATGLVADSVSTFDKDKSDVIINITRDTDSIASKVVSSSASSTCTEDMCVSTRETDGQINSYISKSANCKRKSDVIMSVDQESDSTSSDSLVESSSVESKESNLFPNLGSESLRGMDVSRENVNVHSDPNSNPLSQDTALPEIPITNDPDECLSHPNQFTRSEGDCIGENTRIDKSGQHQKNSNLSVGACEFESILIDRDGTSETSAANRFPIKSSSADSTSCGTPPNGIKSCVGDNSHSIPDVLMSHPPTHWWYMVSKHTERVHLFKSANEDSAMRVNVVIADVLAARDSSQKTPAISRLPDAISPNRSPDAFEHLYKFCTEWSQLRKQRQNKLYHRILDGIPPPDPPKIKHCRKRKAAADIAKGLCTQERTLAGIVRVEYLKKTRFGKRKREVDTLGQVFVDGVPRCLICETGYTLRARDTNKRGIRLNIRSFFCSEECHRRHGINTNSTAIRRELFQIERGVCQKCGVDCRKIYLHICHLVPSSRFVHLRSEKSFKDLERDRLWALCTKSPLGEGHFWEADHIIPVEQGGGQCDIENLQTLCVPCHRVKTRAQTKERAERKRHAKDKAEETPKKKKRKLKSDNAKSDTKLTVNNEQSRGKSPPTQLTPEIFSSPATILRKLDSFVFDSESTSNVNDVSSSIKSKPKQSSKSKSPERIQSESPERTIGKRERSISEDIMEIFSDESCDFVSPVRAQKKQKTKNSKTNCTTNTDDRADSDSSVTDVD